MMRALAQFIMSGRWRAAMVAFTGAWLPLITPATVGLVTLRLGVSEGLLVVLWAVLPPIAALWLSDVAPLMIYATIAVMFVVWGAALYLRSATNWPQTLMILVALATLMAIGLMALVPEAGTALTSTLGEVMEAPEAPSADPLVVKSTTAASGMVAYLIALSSVTALLVSRWWQALVFNPGGFQQEWHNLRLPVVAALTSGGAAAYCVAAGTEYVSWASVFVLPLVLAGTGLVHWLVARFRLGWPALTVFYVGLVFLPALIFTLAALAFIDSWLNVRNRFKSTR